MGLRHLREQWRSYRGWCDAVHPDTEVSANSFPSDFVRAITAALLAL
jgi:hypothetical protein